MEKKVQVIERNLICSACVGDDFLRHTIAKSQMVGTCDYCGDHGKTISMEDLARRFEEAFDSHYRRTDTEPSGWEYSLMKEGIQEWEREGDRVVDVIHAMSDASDDVARDIQRILSNWYFDFESAEMGEELPFSEDSHYAESEPDDSYHQVNWSNFEYSLMTESRFFSQGLKDTLKEIFEVLHDDQLKGKRLIRRAGPGKSIATLYRARVFESEERLKEALARPDLHVGPPPAASARAGRMNAHGISVFYGSTTARIALGEVRPPVGSIVLVAEFELLRPVRLLDVRALDSVYAPGSFFDPETIRRHATIKFLRTLKERMSVPVTPDNERSEYLVTQVVTEYLADRADLKLDGLLYPSVQTKERGANAVLFHRAAKTAAMEFPEDTQVKVELRLYWKKHYSVTETVGNGHRDSTCTSRSVGDDFDYRETTLRVLPDRLAVHRVKRTSYRTEEIDVERERRVVEETKEDVEDELF